MGTHEHDGFLHEDADHHDQSGGGMQSPCQRQPAVLGSERCRRGVADDHPTEDAGPEVRREATSLDPL